MTSGPTTPDRRRTAALVAVLTLQAGAMVFFVGDVVFDIIEDGPAAHVLFEMLVCVALMAGMIFGAIEVRRTLDLVRTQGTALRVAAGELSRVIEAQFRDWALTPAESDVAMLALKGLDVAEIAGLRNAAQGTVRAQLTRIYAKAGVSGRAQFAAFFVEDLLGEGTRPEPAVKVDG
jgi:DNA-binding CsgD family transcriptional regulator